VPPPTLEIAAPAAATSGEPITCRIGPKQTMLALDDAGLHARFVTARGNTVTMFGQDVVVADPADTTLASAVAGFAEGRAGQDWIDVVASVSSPDGQKATVKVSLHVDHAMNKRLDDAQGKAMLFPSEAPTANAHKVAWVRPQGENVTPYVLGDGKWRDIDLVAFESITEKLHDCGSMPGDWGPIGLLHTQKISHIELYDRRTGMRVDETTITGSPECDSGVSNDAPLRAWVSSKLAH